MRRTISLIISLCLVSGSLCVKLNAQIPESAMFQPGSYATRYQPAMTPNAVLASKPAQEDEHMTEWEKKFAPQTDSSATASVPAPQPYEVPYLTYTYCHWKRTFHVAPYEPGYAASPSEFPVQTSPLHVWVSRKSSAGQPRPQVNYMSYHDPDPVILPAEIRIRGSRFLTPLTQAQAMPMPVPKPATAHPVGPPARTRIGERIRQNLGTFVVP